ncbi:MAG: 1-acyl-sn-glycerol-3-phosphate acyltransferase [Flavobacteriia bacterium]|nr:1-acyl-sn-glycerol-3-phosphate acyltransferase [Flavobacteriia bacterium]
MMEEQKYIDVKKIIGSKNPRLLKWLPKFIINYLIKIIHQNEINDFLKRNHHLQNIDFCLKVIEEFKIHIDIQGIENIPKEGKIVLASNHPLGGMDAMALVSGMKGRREDIKFVVNDLLLNLVSLRGIFLGINKHGRNGATMKQQMHTLFSSDNCICIFPAGLVSRKIEGQIIDLEWKKSFISLSKEYNRTIIPVFIDGKLSNFFYRLSNFRSKIGIKVNIEMLYLSNEMFKLRNKKLKIIIGKPIKVNELPQGKSDKAIAQFIKDKVYELKK